MRTWDSSLKFANMYKMVSEQLWGDVPFSQQNWKTWGCIGSLKQAYKMKYKKKNASEKVCKTDHFNSKEYRTNFIFFTS